MDISYKVNEASRKAVFKPKPAVNLVIDLVGMCKATLAPRDRMLVPKRPDNFTTGSYAPSSFPNNPMHPVIPVNLFKYCSSTYEFIVISGNTQMQ